MAFRYQRGATYRNPRINPRLGPKKSRVRNRIIPTRQNFATGAQVLTGLQQAQQLYGPDMQGGTGDDPKAKSAAPTAQPLPFDATYNEQTGLNQKSYQQTLADIQYGQQQLSQSYGYSWDPAANGGYGGILGLDTSNPYNQAAMLQRAYQQSQRGTSNNYAAQGQLYSGALQRGLDEGTFRYSRNQDTLKREFTGAMDQYRKAGQEAKTGYEQGNIDAFGDWVSRSQDLDPEPPVQPSNADKGKFIATAMVGRGQAWQGGHWRQVIDLLGYDPRVKNKKGKWTLKFR